MRDRSRRRWFENAVVYCLDVATFADGNGDGIGDFVGLIDRLDYLKGLGIDTLWLLPFTQSPNRDNRYDVSDYYAVDSDFGDLGDVTRLLRECRQRGIRVIVELVVNHTSIDHPWFLEARDRTSPKHDYYVWRDDKPERGTDGYHPVFPGVSSEVWSWDETAQRYYLHRFYPHQPELNIANPAVRDEVAKIIEFWLDLGVSGFRLDAAPYVVDKAQQADPSDDGMWYVCQLRELVATYGDDAVLFAEADVAPEGYSAFFADGQGINVLFNFWTNGRLFVALACDDPRPLIRALREMPPAPPGASYANWVRNHDELDLEQLDEDERRMVFDRFAPESGERLYGRGIRRRLPPMVDGDRSTVELAYAAAFGLPGIPIVRYGEEIGMGDDLTQPERDAVRTTMQWSSGRSGGFSSARPDELCVPAILDGVFGVERINVADQRGEGGSLLQAVHRLVRARSESPEIGTGDVTVLEDLSERGVLGLRYEGDTDVTVVLQNFSREPVEVATDVLGGIAHVMQLAASDADDGVVLDKGILCLAPHGYRWFRGRKANAP